MGCLVVVDWVGCPCRVVVWFYGVCACYAVLGWDGLVCVFVPALPGLG